MIDLVTHNASRTTKMTSTAKETMTKTRLLERLPIRCLTLANMDQTWESLAPTIQAFKKSCTETIDKRKSILSIEQAVLKTTMKIASKRC